MEMQQVRYFLAVARTLNFTRAAEQCNVTQPALTRAIKQLEEELGGELIRREGRLSHLTELGERMLPLLTRCHDSAIGAKALAEKVRRGEVATLALGVSHALDLALLVAPLHEMRRAFPGIRLKLRRGRAGEIAEWLKGGEIELAIGSAPSEAWDRIDAWPIFTEPFHLIVAPDHAFVDVGTAMIDLAEVREQRLLANGRCDELELDRLEGAGLAVADAHNVDCDRDLEALIEAGFGIAIQPASAMRSPRLRHVPCPPLGITRTVAVHSIAGRSRSREATALLGLLRSADWAAKLAE